jgi:steroid 5-alpha reductase family enzyme
MLLFYLTLHALIAMTAVMVAAWAFGLATKNGGWTDVFWSAGSGVTLAASALLVEHHPISARQWLVAAMAFLWGLRLFAYLAPRVASHPEDVRYAKFRQDFGRNYPIRMLFVTLPQAPATALLALTVIIAASRPDPGLDLRDYAGLALFAVALVGEYVSDEQMRRFRANPANKGQVIETGFWAWSRHPNYFFQWLGWLAYPIIGLDPARPLTWLVFSAAAVMYGLLRYVSGVPPLEAQMLKSRGEKFRKYQERVSVFFPLPPKRVPSE